MSGRSAHVNFCITMKGNKMLKEIQEILNDVLERNKMKKRIDLSCSSCFVVYTDEEAYFKYSPNANAGECWMPERNVKKASKKLARGLNKAVKGLRLKLEVAFDSSDGYHAFGYFNTKFVKEITEHFKRGDHDDGFEDDLYVDAEGLAIEFLYKNKGKDSLKIYGMALKKFGEDSDVMEHLEEMLIDLELEKYVSGELKMLKEEIVLEALIKEPFEELSRVLGDANKAFEIMLEVRNV